MTHPLYFAEYADKGVQSKNFHLKGLLPWRRFQLSQCFHFVLYLQYLITLKVGANTRLHWVSDGSLVSTEQLVGPINT